MNTTGHPAAAGAYARFVGRVGALAVALGVGVAIASGQGVARADDTGATDKASVGTPSEPSGQRAAEPSAEPTGEPPTSAVGSGDADPQQSEDGVVGGTEMNVQSSGGQDTSTNDEGQSTDAKGSGHEAVEENQQDDGHSDVGEATAPQPPTRTRDHGSSVAVNATPAPTPQGSTIQALTVNTVVDENLVVRPQRESGSVETQRFSTVTTTAPEPKVAVAEATPSEPAPTAAVAMTFVSSVLSPLFAPGPGAPANSPLALGLLAWVRGQELRRYSAEGASTTLTAAVVSNAAAAVDESTLAVEDPYQEARGLIEQAASFEEQADIQRDLVNEIYQGELRKADGFWAQAAARYADAQALARAGQLDMARTRIEQAQSFEQQAQLQRALTEEIRQGELRKAQGFFDQAAARRQAAQQLFQEAGFPREALAAGLRLQGHRLRWDAALSADQAAIDQQLATAAWERASVQRQTAQAIRESTSDAGFLDLATQLSQRAAENDQQAFQLAFEAMGLRLRVFFATVVGDLHLGLADLIDPGGL